MPAVPSNWAVLKACAVAVITAVSASARYYYVYDKLPFLLATPTALFGTLFGSVAARKKMVEETRTVCKSQNI